MLNNVEFEEEDEEEHCRIEAPEKALIRTPSIFVAPRIAASWKCLCAPELEAATLENACLLAGCSCC